MLVKQRDNEIAILLNYLNKKKEGNEDPGIPVNRARESDRGSARMEETKDSFTPVSGQKEGNTLFKMMQPSSQKQPVDMRNGS